MRYGREEEGGDTVRIVVLMKPLERIWKTLQRLITC